MDERELKLQRLALLERKKELQEGLPFLHGWPHYTWSRAFVDSPNKDNFLVAANQIGKSSASIRRCIHHASCRELWPTLWKTRPLTFWYLYPTKEVATIEFHKKWVPEFLPRGKFKEDPVYGWREEIRNKNIFALHFNSGVSVYFKSYAQDVTDLQTGTVWEIFCDEELPEDLYSELNMRRSATRGIFNMVFTATLGQEFWREALEETGEKERFPQAFKQRVTMFDCLFYEDGSPSPWTKEHINFIVNSCKSEAEVKRRIYGRFVVDSGLKYPAFGREKNVIKPCKLPLDAKFYCGVDIGSGGDKGHPSAIVFVAVTPDYRQGFVFKGWRGDNIQTTASDVLAKFIEMRGDLVMTGQFYDWQSRDFLTISNRIGEPFVPAEKSHDIGEQVLNVLFRNNMLYIFDTPELRPLASELASIQKDTPKGKAKDDYADGLRYAVTKVPWDWNAISADKVMPLIEEMPQELQDRRKYMVDDEELSIELVEDELEAWNELYED